MGNDRIKKLKAAVVVEAQWTSLQRSAWNTVMTYC